MAGPPVLSVVVAAWTGPDALHSCLASLRAQAVAPPEVLVARHFGGAELPPAARPGTVDVALPATATVPELRAAGLARATGNVIAFLEDHCTCAAGWAGALLSAHAAPHAGVGGPVEQADGASPLEWAVYFYDYGRYMPPCAEGAVEQLSGLNMSFKRSALAEAGVLGAPEVLEAALQSELRRRGHTLWLDPAAQVIHRRDRGGGGAVRHAYHLARSYAHRRLAGAGPAKRLLYGAGALLLPAVLAARIVAQVRRKRRRRIALLLASPWLLVLLGAWAAGEGAGYVLGEGHSAGKWR